MSLKSFKGFTLAELLVALLILAEIATFTIPKVLSSQQNGTRRASAKEAIAMVAAAYSTYQLNNGASASTRFGDITQYMNYVKLDTSGTAFNGTWTCDNSVRCLRLHSGATIIYWDFENFNGTSSSHVVYYVFDPGGASNYSADGIDLFLFYNGRVTEQAGIPPSTVVSCCNTFPWTGNPSYTPAWFSW